MGVIAWPDDVADITVAQCVICRKERCADEMTVGFRDHDNRQRFACNEHFWNRSEFIVGWADFMVKERENIAGDKTPKVGVGGGSELFIC